MANEVGTAYVDVAFDNRQVDREVSGLGSSMAGSFKRIAGVVAGAFVLDKVVDVVRDSIGAASDLNETVSKTGQVFRQSTPAMLKWGESSAEALGLSKTAALDGAASIGAMLIPMGTAPKRAAVMSRSMVQLAADMASFNNEDPSEMLDRIRAGLSGESEPLKRFGTVLSETRVQQFAWANGIAETGKQLTEQQKITARYGLLLQDTKTQQGDFARTSQGLANQQRILSAEWENAQASLGKALLPAAIAVTHALVDLIPVVVRVGNAITDGVGKAVAFVRPLFDALFGSTSSGSKEMSSDFEGVRAVAEPVFRAVGAVVKFAGEIFGTVTSGIRAHSDEIRATMQAIRAIFQAVWPAVSQIVQTAWAIVETTVRTAVRVVGDEIGRAHV